MGGGHSSEAQQRQQEANQRQRERQQQEANQRQRERQQQEANQRQRERQQQEANQRQRERQQQEANQRQRERQQQEANQRQRERQQQEERQRRLREKEEPLTVTYVNKAPWDMQQPITCRLSGEHNDYSGCYIVFSGDTYFQKARSKTFVGKTAQVTLKPLPSRSLLDLHNVTLTVKNVNGDVVGSWSSRWTMENFKTNGFHNHCAKKNCNILFFGVKGGGKSSAINTIFCAVGSGTSPQVNVAESGGSADDHVTIEFRAYKVKWKGYRLIDTWGVTRKNYNPQSAANLKRILSGQVAGGFKMKDENQEVGTRFSSAEEKERRRVDVSLFVIDIIEFQLDEPSRLVEKIIEFLSEATHCHVGTCVLITRADLQYPEFPQHKNLTKWMSSTPEVEKASKWFGLPKSRILLFKSYTDEYHRELEIEKVALQVFDMCQSFGPPPMLDEDDDF